MPALQARSPRVAVVRGAVLGAVTGESSPFVGHDLAEIGRSFEPNWKFLFGALTRDGETVIPRGDQVLRVGDHVRVLTTREARREILELLGENPFDGQGPVLVEKGHQ